MKQLEKILKEEIKSKNVWTIPVGETKIVWYFTWDKYKKVSLYRKTNKTIIMKHSYDLDDFIDEDIITNHLRLGINPNDEYFITKRDAILHKINNADVVVKMGKKALKNWENLVKIAIKELEDYDENN